MDRAAAIRNLWHDSCTVITRQKVTDDTTKITGFAETVSFADRPCKLSFESLSAVGDGNTAAVSQSVKLFIANDLDIPAGSKIIVTRQGKEHVYLRSGEPGVYTYHQEIMLEPWERWS